MMNFLLQFREGTETISDQDRRAGRNVERVRNACSTQTMTKIEVEAADADPTVLSYCVFPIPFRK